MLLPLWNLTMVCKLAGVLIDFVIGLPGGFSGSGANALPRNYQKALSYNKKTQFLSQTISITITIIASKITTTKTIQKYSDNDSDKNKYYQKVSIALTITTIMMSSLINI